MVAWANIQVRREKARLGKVSHSSLRRWRATTVESEPEPCGAVHGQRPSGDASAAGSSAYATRTIVLGDFVLNVMKETLRLLDEVLSLDGRSSTFTRDTALLGAIPELDSMAVVTLITSMEEQLGIIVDDDDIDGSTFATVGSLADFVSGKLAE